MGRTIQSATQTWVEEEQALSRFTRALRKSDKLLIEELIALYELACEARGHAAAPVSAGDIAAIRTCMADLARQWADVPLNGSLVLNL